MQVNNPWAGLLFLVIPILFFLKKRIRRATIILPTIRFIKQSNAELCRKERDWLFVIRILELLFLIVALMDIQLIDFEMPFFTNVVIVALITADIFLRNTFLRTLP